MKDGEMDVIVMEPFDVLDAPQIAADLFMKTLGNNSKIKTFRTKHLHIHRKEEGAIHYDGDPIMTGTDIDVHIEHNGIRIVTNPEAIEDRSSRRRNRSCRQRCRSRRPRSRSRAQRGYARGRHG